MSTDISQPSNSIGGLLHTLRDESMTLLRQEVARSGEEWSFSPRFGVETEALPNWLVLRAGTYYEPTRFENRLRRAHPRRRCASWSIETARITRTPVTRYW